MNGFIYLLPIVALLVFIIAIVKKVNVYQTFLNGVKECLPLLYSLFAPILAVLFMSELFTISGLSSVVLSLLEPIFSVFKIPTEIAPLVLLKPFSGSGSLAILSEILSTYGAESYVSLCAIAVFGSAETTFYVSAIYYSLCKNKNATKAIIISLVANVFATIFACFICRLFY
ncbi:MAG: hypothetical protein IKL82_02175 [Clostridia bacterium]|nr:hypothetical protein [Clostridia bacterium]